MTDLDRTTILQDPDTARAIRERTHREGSTKNAVNLGHLRVSVTDRDGAASQLSLGMNPMHGEGVATVLRGRLPHGRELHFLGRDAHVVLRPGERGSWSEAEDGEIEVVLTPTAVESLLSVLETAEPGTHSVEDLPDVEIVLEDPPPAGPR